MNRSVRIFLPRWRAKQRFFDGPHRAGISIRIIFNFVTCCVEKAFVGESIAALKGNCGVSYEKLKAVPVFGHDLAKPARL